jgi:hypothetical protein
MRWVRWSVIPSLWCCKAIWTFVFIPETQICTDTRGLQKLLMNSWRDEEDRRRTETERKKDERRCKRGGINYHGANAVILLVNSELRIVTTLFLVCTKRNPNNFVVSDHTACNRILYLTTFLKCRGLLNRMVQRVWMIKWERCKMKLLWPILRYHTSICLQGLSNPTKKLCLG